MKDDNEVVANANSATAGTLSSQKAQQFADRWQHSTNEKQDGQSFWREFFADVLEIPDIRAAGIEFEKTVSSAKGTTNFIDCFWKNIALIEHKSAGKDLDVAETQARGYISHLPPAQRPPVIIVSDFARMRLVDVFKNQAFEFELKNLPDHLDRFEALLTQQGKNVGAVEIEADAKAAELMAALYQEFEKSGYSGHEVSVFLVRILFLLFGSDTRMFPSNSLPNFLEDTHPEGRDVGGRLQELFQALNTPPGGRPKTLDPLVAVFPYVNGGLFAEQLPIFSFNKEMRQALLNANAYSWQEVNPSIFGAMFQEVKNKVSRRKLGEHYTSEKNILKVIRPLFLDELLDELESSWDNVSRLKRLMKKLGQIKIADMACGAGNFLVVAYKELRALETKILARLRVLSGTEGNVFLDGTMGLEVHLGNFYGVEIEEWSSQIASVAMFLTDHQANLALEEITGAAPNRFPLSESANILHANALDFEWETFIPKDDNLVILGNPPFIGSRLQSNEQRQNQAKVWGNLRGSGMVDFVSNWFILSARHIRGTAAKAGLVSTSSITQGDQAAMLWQVLSALDMEICFAHKTFAWDNDASGQAAVHCVIVGFSAAGNTSKKLLWTYPEFNGEPELRKARFINAYLVDGADVLVKARRTPLRSGIPPLLTGNEPRDGGFLSNISVSEAEEIRQSDPVAARYLRPLIGSEELLNGLNSRFCLWLLNASPSEIKNSSVLRERVRKVRENREQAIGTKSAKAKTVDTPWLFSRIAQPEHDFIAVPSVSSEKRDYIPIAYLSPDYVINNAVFFINSVDLALFALLESRPFTLWVETVSSRLESRFQISASSVYNTFPFPHLASEQDEVLKKLATEVLDARKQFSDTSLGNLYDPLLMPIRLRKAHKALDKQVLKIMGVASSASDEEVIAHLFAQYQSLNEQSQLI